MSGAITDIRIKHPSILTTPWELTEDVDRADGNAVAACHAGRFAHITIFVEDDACGPTTSRSANDVQITTCLDAAIAQDARVSSDLDAVRGKLCSMGFLNCVKAFLDNAVFSGQLCQVATLFATTYGVVTRSVLGKCQFKHHSTRLQNYGRRGFDFHSLDSCGGAAGD